EGPPEGRGWGFLMHNTPPVPCGGHPPRSTGREPHYGAANPGAGPAASPPGLARSATGWQALTRRRGQRVTGVKPGRRATFFPVAPAGVEVRRDHMFFCFV